MPREHEAWRREMGEASSLPADDPRRLAVQAEVSRVGPWAEAEWLALLQEGERWRLELSRVEVPEGLEERLLGIPAEAGSRPLAGLWRRPAFAVAAVAAAALLALGAWLVLGSREAKPDPLDALALLAMNDHLDTHTLDVQAADPVALREGLKSKIPFEILLPDLGGSLRLEGGRRCTLGSHAVCFTTWRDASGRYTLLQLRREDFGLPESLAPTVVTPRGAAAGTKPLAVLIWTRGGFGYALVADDPTALRAVRPK